MYSSIWNLVAFLVFTIIPRILAAPTDINHATILSREDQIQESYDYIIVGGGTAGLTIADRLTEDGRYTVLVIEYGYLTSQSIIVAGNGRDFNDPGIRYNITSTKQPGMNNKTQAVVIGCCVGGSSAINGMIVIRGTRTEYDGWKELGSEGSSWDWDGVIPYFRKALHFNPPSPELAQSFNITWDPSGWGEGNHSMIQASFPTYQNPVMIPTRKAMAKMPNMDEPVDGANGENGLFWHPSSFNPVNFYRSFARTQHYDSISRPNYQVITGQKVNKILFASNTTRATGVQFTSRNPGSKPLAVKASKEIIISAGTIHTPQVLQMSGIGPRDLLEKAGIEVKVELPGVGANFQDHAWLNVGYIWSNGTPAVPSDIRGQGDPKTGYAPNLGAWIGMPTVSPDGYEDLAARYEAQDPAAYMPPNTHPDVIAGYAAFQKFHANLMRKKNANFLWLPLKGDASSSLLSMHVLSHGSININPLSPSSEPIVDYRALTNPIDIDIMVENIEFLRRYMSLPDFATSKPVETNPGANIKGEALREWIRRNWIPTTFHPTGTAAKIPRDRGGVVDEDLLVYGTEGLSVADASIMPLPPGANTQSTVYMIAEKAADMLKARQ